MFRVSKSFFKPSSSFLLLVVLRRFLCCSFSLFVRRCFSIAILCLGAFLTFVRFALVWFCLSSSTWCLRRAADLVCSLFPKAILFFIFVIVALLGLFFYLFGYVAFVLSLYAHYIFFFRRIEKAFPRDSIITRVSQFIIINY